MDLDHADRLWGHRIANHRLSSGILPAPDSEPEVLLHFAGTFDGYAVRPDLSRWLPEHFLPWFQEHGRLPALSLTMARAVLFGFQRWHHMTT